MAKNFRTEYFRGPKMRGSYTFNLFTARKNDSGVESYGCTLIAPKSADWTPLQNAIKEAVIGQWGDKGIERFKKGLIRNPIIDGMSKSAHDAAGGLREGMGEDVMFIRVKSNDPVAVYDNKIVPITDAKGFPSGFWGIPVLNAFSWSNPQNGDGVSFGIKMFQVLEEDDILGGGGLADPKAYYEKVDTSDDGGKPAASAGDMFA